MAKRVYVTSAQTRAAKTLVARSAVTGRFVSAEVRKIASASVDRHTAANTGMHKNA